MDILKRPLGDLIKYAVNYMKYTHGVIVLYCVVDKS